MSLLFCVLMGLAVWLVMSLPPSFENVEGYYHDPDSTKATVTAYSEGTICADGTRPIAGHTIAAPRSVPFGTKVYIEGLGYRCVHDRTAKKYNGRWDVYFATRSEAILFGKQQLTIEIIK